MDVITPEQQLKRKQHFEREDIESLKTAYRKTHKQAYLEMLSQWDAADYSVSDNGEGPKH